MLSTLALIACAILVMFLLRIERKRNQDASHAVWIPTIWMLICGSRPLGRWFVHSLGGSQEAGSPLDRLVLSMLILLALVILYKRKIDWSRTLKGISWLIILYLYLGLSILWSDHQFISFKRLFRLLGAIPVAMVVLSERSPLKALEGIFRRCVYVLIPFSFILIKYFPHLGRSYGRWSGALMWTGVTTTKNGLGQLCLFSIFFIIWVFLRNRRTEDHSKAKSTTFADGLVFAIAVFLLAGAGGAYSATSIVTTLIVIASLVLFYRKENSAWNIANLIIFMSVLMWLFLIVSQSFVLDATSFLGRDATFTGRTEIWAMILDDASRHPFLGTGFGNYFGLDNEFSRAFWGYTTGHNGLLDVYVEVGILGVLMLLIYLLKYYGRFRKELNSEFDWGIFGICLLEISLLTNFTESLFLKSSSYIWNSMIFLTVVFSAQCLDAKGN